jgi:hypothetical protein
MQSLRALLPYLTALVVISLSYAAWTIYSRHEANRNAVQNAKKAEAEADRKVVDTLGGDSLKIMAFYASPATVKHGEKTLVCYGVSNAKTVEITPHIDDITPSLSRCLEVVPRQTTEYKLTAADAQGHKSEQSLVLRVE